MGLSEEVDELTTVGRKKGKSNGVKVSKAGVSVMPQGDSAQTAAPLHTRMYAGGAWKAAQRVGNYRFGY